MATCSQCGSDGMANGVCRKCWGVNLGRKRRRYTFTAELQAELRRAYAGDRKHLSEALDRLEKRTGWPRIAFWREARLRGLTQLPYRAWTAAEVEYLEEALGRVAIRTIAARLHRSAQSVEAYAERIGRSRRITEGYSVADLAACFGVNRDKAAKWMERGLLGKVHVNGCRRVTEANVLRFVRRHYSEYDLRAVDQLWFKATLFSGGGFEHGKT